MLGSSGTLIKIYMAEILHGRKKNLNAKSKNLNRVKEKKKPLDRMLILILFRLDLAFKNRWKQVTKSTDGMFQQLNAM